MAPEVYTKYRTYLHLINTGMYRYYSEGNLKFVQYLRFAVFLSAGPIA